MSKYPHRDEDGIVWYADGSHDASDYYPSPSERKPREESAAERSSREQHETAEAFKRAGVDLSDIC